MKKTIVDYNNQNSNKINYIKINFILLFVICFGLLNNNANSQIFGNLTEEHQQFQKFVGEWNQISSLTNLEGKKSQTKGKIVCNIILSGTLLELKGLQGNQEMITESLMYIGYDKSIEKFYLHGYDRNGGIPNTYLGTFNKNTNKYLFETYMIDEKKGKILSTFEIWFERDDKFIYKATIHDPDKPIVIMEVANLKAYNSSKDNNIKINKKNRNK